MKIKAQETIFQNLMSLRLLKLILTYYKYASINEYIIKIFIESLLSSVQNSIDKGKTWTMPAIKECMFYLTNMSDMLKNACFTVNNEATY